MSEQQQISAERTEQLKALIGKEVFCIAYTLQGDGTIEVLTISDVVASPDGYPIQVILNGRPWRQHQLGTDTFMTLTEAARAATAARDAEVIQLRATADKLVQMQFRAPSDKVKEEEARNAAAMEAAKKQAAELEANALAAKKTAKPAAKTVAKPAAKRPARPSKPAVK